MGKNTRKWIIGIAIAILLFVIYKWATKGSSCTADGQEEANQRDCDCKGISSNVSPSTGRVGKVMGDPQFISGTPQLNEWGEPYGVYEPMTGIEPAGGIDDQANALQCLATETNPCPCLMPDNDDWIGKPHS